MSTCKLKTMEEEEAIFKNYTIIITLEVGEKLDGSIFVHLMGFLDTPTMLTGVVVSVLVIVKKFHGKK